MHGNEGLPDRTVPVLLNPRAGGARGMDAAALTDRLRQLRVPARVETVAPDALPRRLDRMAGLPLIGIAGGDGSLATAAAALLGSDTILLPIPTGRLNHFARRAGIGSVEAAAGAARDGHWKPVYVGRAASAVFLDTAVVGGYRDFVHARERLRPLLTTWPAALVAGLLAFARWRRVPLSIRTEAMDLDDRTAMLWVGLGRSSFPEPHQAPLATTEDALDVVILPGGRAAAGALAGALLRYRLRGRRELTGGRMKVFPAPWLELDSPGPIPIVLDGEPRLLEPPVRIEFGTRPLRLAVPAPRERPRPDGDGAEPAVS